MRDVYHDELDDIGRCVLELIGQVRFALERATSALLDGNLALADRVIGDDKRIDDLRADIEDRCVQLIAKQQPVATDLRVLISTIHLISDLERMGDLSVRIAQSALALMKDPVIRPLIDIPHIAGLAQGMVRKALDAFVNRDPELARSVLASDDAVDNMRTASYHELISFMEKNPNQISQALYLLSTVRNLERIADHATNIAEDVLFLVKGIDVRHHNEERSTIYQT